MEKCSWEHKTCRHRYGRVTSPRHRMEHHPRWLLTYYIIYHTCYDSVVIAVKSNFKSIVILYRRFILNTNSHG